MTGLASPLPLRYAALATEEETMTNANGQRIRVAAQTITWGETIRENLPAILETLAGLGYEGAEIGVRHFDLGRPVEYRALFADKGIVPLAVHTGGTFWDEAQAQREMAGISNGIAFAAEVGFRYFALSGNRGETPASMVKAAAAYERIGAECREAGLQLIYHNHDWEFANDMATLRVLLEHTSPKHVKLLPDVAWIDCAGVDAAAFLRAQRDRLGYMHFKDRAGERFCELGAGELNLDIVLAAYGGLDADWLVVEQDTTETTAEQSLGESAAWLRQAGVLA